MQMNREQYAEYRRVSDERDALRARVEALEAKLAAAREAVDGALGLGCTCEVCLDVIRVEWMPKLRAALSDAPALAVVETTAMPGVRHLTDIDAVPCCNLMIELPLETPMGAGLAVVVLYTGDHDRQI